MKIQVILILLITTAFAHDDTSERQAEAFSDGKTVDAVSYGLGSNGGYTLKNENNYKVPQMVSYLVKSKSPYENASKSQEAADEVPSVTNYYDGTNQLNKIQVKCKMYTGLNDCVHQAGCGWCGATSSCITGNQAGPLEACSKSTYVFTSGAIYTPQDRVVKEDVGGVSMTIISK